MNLSHPEKDSLLDHGQPASSIPVTGNRFKRASVVGSLLLLAAVLVALSVTLSSWSSITIGKQPEEPSGVYSTVSSWTRVGSTLTGDTTGDSFGSSLALSMDGGIVAVGAPENDQVAENAGSVQVYQRTGSKKWNGGLAGQQDEWQPMGAALQGVAKNDFFGTSVALSANGRFLAVGATEYYTGRPGYVCVFEYDGRNGEWKSRGSTILGVAAQDRFGYSMAVSSDGSLLAVGAPNNSDNGSLAGHVRVFRFDYNDWVQQGLTLTGVGDFDLFGSSVDLSAQGSILAVGAPAGQNDHGAVSGHVRLFQFNKNDWEPLGVAISGVVKGQEFGRSIALSSNGMILVASAPDTGGNNSGHVRVFDYDTSSNQWMQRGSAITGFAALDEFGSLVALSADGNRMAVGGTNNEGIANDSGLVHVFQYERNRGSGQWKQVGAALKGGSDDWFGVVVAMSADGTVVMGAATETNISIPGVGYVCLYEGLAKNASIEME